MLVFGGVDDFCQNLGDTVAYDIEKSRWEYILKSDLYPEPKKGKKKIGEVVDQSLNDSHVDQE